MKNAKLKSLIIVLAVTVAICLIAGFSYAWLSNPTRSDLNLSASIQRSYFESGTGTEEDPYEIRRPIQLFYFSWLQQMGYFNEEDPENPGNIKQTYFYLSSDIDMQGFTIPSIGTATYPFVGNFDGNGHVVSNLYVQNNSEEFTHEPKSANYGNNPDQIVGFFGVIGALDETDGAKVNGFTYSKSANAIKDFCLDSVMITSETPKDDKTLIGIVAGYVNGDVSGVAVCNSGIFVKDDISPLGETLYAKISDYTTIGFCTDEYKNNFQIVEVSLSNVLVQNTEDGGSGSGSGGGGGTGPGGEAIDDVPGNAWGGSINMKDLFARLYDIYSNRADGNYSYYGIETRYQYIDAPELNRVEGRSAGGMVNGGLSGTGWGAGTIFETNKFRVFDQNYDEGAVTFSQSLFDGGESYLYLIGEIDENFDLQGSETSPFINKVSTVHTLARTPATGTYINSGNNYLSVRVPTSGTPSLVNVTDKNSASVWFAVANGGKTAYFTQVNGENYYLTITKPNLGTPTLSVSKTASYVWDSSENMISSLVKGVRLSILSSSRDITYSVRCQNNRWSLTEVSSSSMFITDGTNYLSYAENGTELNIINQTSSDVAVVWTRDSNAKTIYTAFGEDLYYLVNDGGVLKIVSESNVQNGMVRTWDTGLSADGKNYIKNKIGLVEYVVRFNENWTLVANQTYTINYGANHLKYNATTNGFENVASAANATVWTFSNAMNGGEISFVSGGEKYYLAINGSSLVVSKTIATNWTISQNAASSSDVIAYDFTATVGGVTYYLICESGVWGVVRADAGRYVIGTKYSLGGNATYQYWMSHDLKTSTDKSHFTTTKNLETAPIFTLDSATQYMYFTAANGDKFYFGDNITWFITHIHNFLSLHNNTQTGDRARVTIDPSNNNVTLTAKYNGKDYSDDLGTNGSQWGFATGYDMNARAYRPPMSVTPVTGQNVNFQNSNGLLNLESTESSYFSEVAGSPKQNEVNQVSKLHGTYIPISVIATTDANYVARADGNTSYITSQRNTGYIVSGASYQKYGGYSTYRLGDIRVANYNLDELSEEYFNVETNEILQVLTSNSYGANQVYDKDNGSTYFNVAFPKIQSILQSGGEESKMYGIHFMDAQISKDRTTVAEKAVIEHVSYYDYELPESSIDFNLMSNGYINFFAGTYAKDAIVGNNDSFFTLYQVFRYKDLLDDAAIIAVYVCDGMPTVFKMNNERYYYFNTTTNQLNYIKNIDNVFDTGSSLDDIYLQVTSGIFIDKTNPTNTIYYTLRNDVRPGYYYTFDMATTTFTECYVASLGENYVSINGITDVKQIKKIFTRYTAAGGSSLATKDVIYLYSDGTYSKGVSPVTISVTENFDNSVTYDGVKYGLSFDLAWIDTKTDVVTDAIYYFEIPVTKGEYCLGSVEGGKGAYLLYLDLSTNASTGSDGSITNEAAIVETKTTKIETYIYPKGVAVIESVEDFGNVPDYETVNVALTDPDGCTISRVGDDIVITTSSGEVVYVTYDLLANGTAFSNLEKIVPYKTTIITEETTTIKKTEVIDGVETITSQQFVTSTAGIVKNRKISVEYESILTVSSYGVLAQPVVDTEVETPVIDVTVDFTPDANFEITQITATVKNNTDEDREVMLVYIADDPSYTYKKNDGETSTDKTVDYEIILVPADLQAEGDTTIVSPEAAS